MIPNYQRIADRLRAQLTGENRIRIAADIKDSADRYYVVLGLIIHTVVADIHHPDTMRCQRLSWVQTEAMGHFVKRGDLGEYATKDVSRIVGCSQLKCNVGVDVPQILVCCISNFDIPTHSENSLARSAVACLNGRLRPAAMSSNPLATSASSCESVNVVAFMRECCGNCTANGRPR